MASFKSKNKKQTNPPPLWYYFKLKRISENWLFSCHSKHLEKWYLGQSFYFLQGRKKIDSINQFSQPCVLKMSELTSLIITKQYRYKTYNVFF